MARHPFGGGAPDWAVSTADGVPVEAVGGAIVKAYSAFLGGTQYTDLSMDQEGTQVVSQIVASDGTDGLMLGQIPQFYGPDGVWEVWLSANNGPRVRAQALDTADLVQGALDSIADVQTTLDQADADHASLGQANGIATLGADGVLTESQRPALPSLPGVDADSPDDGDALVFDADSSTWKPSAVSAPPGVHVWGWQTTSDAAVHVANNQYSGIGGAAPTVVLPFAHRDDPDGLMDSNGVVTIAAAGLYQIEALAVWGNSAVTPVGCWIMTTGSAPGGVFKSPDTPSYSAHNSAVMYLAAGDTVRIGVWHNYGSTRDVTYSAVSIEKKG
jgi:hypothetical protein